jgi:HK97 family phage major capsid protein
MDKAKMPRAPIAALSAAQRPAGVVGAVRAETSQGSKVESLLSDVKQELARVNDEVKRTADDALKQARETGETTSEVKAKADELMSTQAKLQESQTKLEGKLEALETRNLDLEQKLAQGVPGSGREANQSFGQMVAESDEVKQFVGNGARGTLRFPVKNAITSVVPGGGATAWSDREDEIVRMPRRQMRIRQLLNQGTTTSNLVEYAKQTTRDNQAAMTAETNQKPESDYAWDRADAPVRTLAHFVHVARQTLQDAGQLQAEIDSELRYGLEYVEELQLLKGDGTGENLSGLVTEATAFSNAFVPTNPTYIDKIRLQLLQASLAEYPADGIVLHPTDWARIELEKDANNQYLFASIVQMAGPQLWGRPVIATQAMDEDASLCGAFGMAATIYDRMDSEVLISSEDRDNFIKNMLTIRAEKRLALAVKRPAALVYNSSLSAALS